MQGDAEGRGTGDACQSVMGGGSECGVTETSDGWGATEVEAGAGGSGTSLAFRTRMKLPPRIFMMSSGL